MLMFLSRYWKEVSCVVVAFLVVSYVGYQKLVIVGLEGGIKAKTAELAQRDAYISIQNAEIEANRVNYEKKLGELPAVINTIEKKYYPVEKKIVEWRDSNETKSCDESMQYINNFSF